MSRGPWLITTAMTLACAALLYAHPQGSAPARQAQRSNTVAALSPRAVVDAYCVTCHNAKLKTAGLMLDGVDFTDVAGNAEVLEAVVLKVRAGMMPPTGMRRPAPEVLARFVSDLEGSLDRAAVPHAPAPGLHRLNRAEYANAVRDLLDIDIDPSKFLPPDDSTHGFDNQAAALVMTPSLLEGYLSAARKISRLALGSATAATETVFPVPADSTQNYHVAGLPFGSRGGLLIPFEAPADGDYHIRVYPLTSGNMDNSNIAFGEVAGEQLDVIVDGQRLHSFDWDKEVGRGYVVRAGVQAPTVRLTAGLHRIGVTFKATNYAPLNDLSDAFLRSTIETGGVPGITFFPHLGKVRVDGPFEPQPSSASPSRQRIFVCRPAVARDEEPCATRIITALAGIAYRRPATATDVQTLLAFYRPARAAGTFDNGVEMVVRRVLADAEFLYRRELETPGAPVGRPYRISDVELASRLSFFLWSSIPDAELRALASSGRLARPAVLQQQVRRMLADPRSDAFVANFAGQWLNLRGLQGNQPVTAVYPDYDDNLRESFRREVELFVGSVVHRDRSVMDLLTADYTFVDERLAKHYGIPQVYGSEFREVRLGDAFDVRRGLLGKGALMTVTSQPGRTSPVQRGKWFLQTFLGVTPPDPPPNVPDLPVAKTDSAGNLKEPSMRERMQQHRASPACAGCHQLMDPIGFALENFDAIGSWRLDDEGGRIDASGTLVDGTPLDGPASLRRVLLRYGNQYVQTLTQRLLVYGLGRGLDYHDMPVVRAIVRQAADKDYRFSALVLGIVQSTPFTMSTKAVDDKDTRRGE